MEVKPSAMLQVFNGELEQAGWEVEDLGEMLAAGISVSPEGMASRKGDAATIEAHLCLSESQLRIFILKRDTDQMVRLVLEFKQHLHGILRLLITEQDKLDTKTFPQFLHQASKMAERIWFVDHEGARFLLEFPSSGGQ